MEVVVAAGIFGIIALAMATMIANFSRSIEEINIQQDRAALVMMLQGVIKNQIRCNDAIGTNQNFDLNLAQSVDNLKGMPLSLNLGDGIVIRANLDIPNFKIRTHSLMLTNAKPVGADGAGNALYAGSLWARFSGSSQNSSAKERILRNQPIGDITVTVKNGLVIACSSSSMGGSTQFFCDQQSGSGSCCTFNNKMPQNRSLDCFETEFTYTNFRYDSSSVDRQGNIKAGYVTERGTKTTCLCEGQKL